MDTLRQDEFGKKPLYYHKGSDGSVVSGESVLGLLERGVPRKLDRRGLLGYLTYGAVPGPLTLIEGVRMLPAGHELADGEPKRYWKPGFEPKFGRLGDAQSAVSERVREAVAKEMAGGVSAAFLSGGIDSGAIVAMMRKVAPDAEIRTYCVKHDDDATEESVWAAKVAEANHTRHATLRLTDAMMRDHVLEAVDSYDQPTLDGVNFWFACKLVKEAGEKTVLSGEGGDELFAGYDRFAKHVMAYRWASRLAKCGSAVWGGMLGPIVEALAPNEKMRKLGALMHLDCDPYSLPRRVFSPAQARSFVRPELRADAEDFQCSATHGYAPGAADLVNRISWLELQTVTTDSWLRDGHQTASVHGLDVRTPLLDRELAETLFAVPGAMKLCPEYLKPLLVHAAGDGLPMECVIRKKQGFSLPFQRYFTGDLKEMIDDFLEGKDLLLFEPAAVRKLGKLYRAGRVNWSRVWTLFVAERWCRENGVGV